jgi:hypothetical protein
LAEQSSSEKDKREREEREFALRLKIDQARANASPEGKIWQIGYEADPASGKNTARRAYNYSNDGLCKLTVEKRLNGARLTDLHCPDFKISEYEDIEVKFDNLSRSDKMDLDSYSNSDDVYISSQSSYSGYLDYDVFIKRLKSGNTVAIKIPTSPSVWMQFSLEGAAVAINSLGNTQ